jgi:hypothetical protein
MYDRRGTRFLTAKIELFTYLSAPTYWVVVAEASDDLVMRALRRDPRRDHQ